ncbi:hypothetical protein Cpir12675_003248 [Ceratocystis pirilliformis]|uniref:VASt domain-containing protein n=1 Tax=Ceratocystis pirilliformis TaxID=259994 RepID=A0ABR3Z599_9PEZI
MGASRQETELISPPSSSPIPPTSLSASRSPRLRQTSPSLSTPPKEDTRAGRFPVRVSRGRLRNSFSSEEKQKRFSTPLSPPTTQTVSLQDTDLDISVNSASNYTFSAYSTLRNQPSTSSLLSIARSRPESRDGSQPDPSYQISSHKSSTFPRIRRSDTGANGSSTRLALTKSPGSRRSPSPGGKLRGIFRVKRSNSSLVSSTSEPGDILPESHGLSKVPAASSLALVQEDDSLYTTQDSSQRSLPTPINSQSSVTPPKTPPTGTKAPVFEIINTPPTPTKSQIPSSKSSIKSIFSSPSSTFLEPPSLDGPVVQPPPPPPIIRVSTSGILPGQRRLRSGSTGPSKLSKISRPPLSPTPESASNTPSNDTPESVPDIPVLSPGFLSSMLSAAQSAATSIGNSIVNTASTTRGTKTRSLSLSTSNSVSEAASASTPQLELAPSPTIPTAMERKEPAVKTLGAGDLSLSQLGFNDPASTANASSINPSQMPNDISHEPLRGRSESSPADPQHPAEMGADEHSQSMYEKSTSDASPNHSVYGDANVATAAGIHRSGSIRSALERHRKRGGSAATGNTIGAAIAAVNHPSLPLHTPYSTSVPKLTGFAIASKKRNKDFHTLFKSVPDDDYLIEDYSCALQREILCQGRLYVSEGHLCFSSNILGWITTLVIRFDEIVAVEKRNTALIFKNGLMISTLQNRHIFASFTSRDATYDLIINIWKLGHHTLEITADKTEKTMDDPTVPLQHDDVHSGSEDGSDEEDDVYDEDDDNTYSTPESVTMANSSFPEADTEKTGTRKLSTTGGTGGTASDVPPASAGSGQDFPGPATHGPTDCGDEANHYDRVVGDDIMPAPLGKVYDLLFGPASVNFLQKFIIENQRCTEYTTEDRKGLTSDNKTRTFTYIKPLNAPIGPKQTKCIVTEMLDVIDLSKAVNVTVSTQTPDVPSGNVFTVKTHYCLSWAENNQTRIQVNCTVEWSGKSWIKSPIEKGANDGQVQYCNDLFGAIRLAISTRPRAGTNSGAATKSKKKSRKSNAAESSPIVPAVAPAPPPTNWGPLEPARFLLEPVVEIAKPFLAGNLVYGLLAGLLIATWLGFGSQPTTHSTGVYNSGAHTHMGFSTYPDRIVAYEEMWRREESQLWDWLEERVQLGRMMGDPSATSSGTPPGMRRKPTESRTVEDRLREEKMDELQIKEAIAVTQRKLDLLKEAMEKRVAAKERMGEGI